ncbi:hypothetical protein [Streptomyces sp. NPDC095613]|uniref:hypothetical protein n=1 Tax=Streptomyces sp. NPDC095613 TaxID=3155540 RepID=UPI0033215AE1
MKNSMTAAVPSAMNIVRGTTRRAALVSSAMSVGASTPNNPNIEPRLATIHGKA